MIIHLLWIVPIIITVCFIVYQKIKYGSIKNDILLSIPIAMLSFLIIIIVTFIVILLTQGTSNRYEYTKETYQISCLSDSSTIKGRQYLFSGCIDGINQYKVYKINEDGSKELVKFNAENVKVYEDGKTEVTEYAEEFESDFVKWLIGSNGDDTTRYEIHIPQGTITTEYGIDLK